VIGVVVAIVVVAGALTSLAIYAITATRRAGEQQARGDVMAVRMEVAIANAKNESNRADAEKERADALDAAIVLCAADAVGPVAGSFERLLQARAAASTANRDRAPAVRDAGTASGEASPLGPDDLLPLE
jgi:hypothetical protein